MKHVILFTAAFLLAAVPAFSQDIQLHYDLGKSLYNGGSKDLSTRPTMTSTVEMFRPDAWGNTFFFVDMNYGVAAGPVNSGRDGGVRGAYWEISRELKFWDAPFLAHVEYNGGMDDLAGSYDDAWLVGPTWSWANSDFSKTFSFTAMYKYIPRNVKNSSNFQLTAVWNVYFCNRMFLFDGFADFWRENRPWQKDPGSTGDGTDFIFLSEPQFWFNFNALPGWKDINFSLGSETEISSNFVGKGWWAIPTLACKWTF